MNVFLMGVAYQGGHPISICGDRENDLTDGRSRAQYRRVRWGRKYFTTPVRWKRFSIRPSRSRLNTPASDARAGCEISGAAYADQYSRNSLVKLPLENLPSKKPVARYLYKLMAYKDEYQVARL